MDHILSIDYDKCTGCRSCEMACSIAHEKTFNPARGRIQVVKQERENIIAPIVCLQCDSPLCQDACPNGAIVRNELGVLYVERETCVGCMNCTTACIYGGIAIDPITRKAIKCDLCLGDPKCVGACEYGAISYLAKEEGIQERHVGVKGVIEIKSPSKGGI